MYNFVLSVYKLNVAFYGARERVDRTIPIYLKLNVNILLALTGVSILDRITLDAFPNQQTVPIRYEWQFKVILCDLG